MKKFTTNAFVIPSTILFLVAVVGWIRSYGTCDWPYVGWPTNEISGYHERTSLSLISLRGRLKTVFGHLAGQVSLDTDFGWQVFPADEIQSANGSFWNRMGFGFVWQKSAPTEQHLVEMQAAGKTIVWGERSFMIPYWFLALLLAIAPGVKLRMILRKRTSKSNGTP